MTRTLGVLALTVALAAVGCQNMDNHDNDMNTANPGQLSSADKQFVMDAASSGMYEVEAGQAAAAKGGNDAVRMLGQHMVKDHTDANQKLMDIARQKGIMMPPAMNEHDKDMLTKLNNLSGSAFDDEYVRQQKAAHQQAISKFQREAKSGSDADIKNFAAQTLPTLKEHQQMINDNAAAATGGMTGGMKSGNQ